MNTLVNLMLAKLHVLVGKIIRIQFTVTPEHLGEERHYESKVSYPRTQHSAWTGLERGLIDLESSTRAVL